MWCSSRSAMPALLWLRQARLHPCLGTCRSPRRPLRTQAPAEHKEAEGWIEQRGRRLQGPPQQRPPCRPRPRRPRNFPPLPRTPGRRQRNHRWGCCSRSGSFQSPGLNGPGLNCPGLNSPGRARGLKPESALSRRTAASRRADAPVASLGSASAPRSRGRDGCFSHAGL